MKVHLSVLLLAGLLLGVCTAAPSRLEPRERAPERVFNSYRAHSLVERAANDDGNWIKDHVGVVAGASAAAGFVIIVLVVLIIVLCCCYFSYKRNRKRMSLLHVASSQKYGPSSRQPPRAREPEVAEAMNKQKREKEIQEKTRANETVNYFLRNHTEYTRTQDLSDLGSRMQKHWFKVKIDGPVLLLTTTPVSQKCPLELDRSTLKGINKLVNELKKHPFIQPIVVVDYLEIQQQLVIVQPFCDGGSLKDTIYRASPTTDWSRKYSRRSHGLTVDQVRRYGRQILEAMLFLYNKGFPVLGHIQSGNVFIVDGVCRVGGYENTLLGYKTRLFKMCKEKVEQLDIIMFGHLLFEMCCGYELTQMYPTEADLKSVKKTEAREILQFIFTEDFPHSIQKIKDNPFFASESLPKLNEFDLNTVKVAEHKSIQNVLEKVRKGKARTQKVPKKKKDEGDVTPVPGPRVTPPPKEDKTPVPKVDKTPVAKGKSQKLDKTPPHATPIKHDDSRATPTADVEACLDTGDSAGDQSGDSKEGKRKRGLKSKLGFGGKKKKELTATDHPDGADGAEDVDDDTTPIVTSRSEERA